MCKDVLSVRSNNYEILELVSEKAFSSWKNSIQCIIF